MIFTYIYHNLTIFCSLLCIYMHRDWDVFVQNNDVHISISVYTLWHSLMKVSTKFMFLKPKCIPNNQIVALFSIVLSDMWRYYIDITFSC